MQAMRTREKKLTLNRETLRRFEGSGGPIGIGVYSIDTRCTVCNSIHCPPVQER